MRIEELYYQEMMNNEILRMRERQLYDMARYGSSVTFMDGTTYQTFTGAITPKPKPQELCSHKPVPQKMWAYFQQLIDYYRQAFPEHRYPVEEGAMACMHCVVHHYKKLKTV